MHASELCDPVFITSLPTPHDIALHPAHNAPEKIMMKKMNPITKGCARICLRTFCRGRGGEGCVSGRTSIDLPPREETDSHRSIRANHANLPLSVVTAATNLPEARGLLATVEGGPDECLALGVGHALGDDLRAIDRRFTNDHSVRLAKTAISASATVSAYHVDFS